MALLDYTPDQLREAASIKEDVVYFAQNHTTRFVATAVDAGWVEGVDSPAVLRILEATKKNENIIIRHARQVGVSTALEIYVAHTALTRPGITIAICSNNMANSSRMGNIIKQYLKNLNEPVKCTFLIDKIYFSVLENKSKIICYSPTPEGLRGAHIDELIFDNLAYVPQNKAQDFLSNCRIALSPNGRMILASAIDGCETRNEFERVWKNAGPNWKRLDIKWWDMPRAAEGLTFTKNSVVLPDPKDEETRQALVELGWEANSPYYQKCINGE